MEFVDYLLRSAGIYLLSGLVFAIYFIFFGAAILDTGIKEDNLKFKLIILPGSIVLWPYLIFRLIRKKLNNE